MIRLLTLWVTVFAFLGLQSTTEASDLVGKLLQFGYLRETVSNGRLDTPTPEEVIQALIKFQEFNGLIETGTYDRPTRKLLLTPRCGNKDMFYDNGAYTPHNFNAVKRWNKKEITWNLVKYSETGSLSREQQQRAIQQGLQHWSNVTPLTFKNVSGRADIMISFEKYKHGDNSPFDGPGGILAHAFFPGRRPLNGDTHIDDSEVWTEGKNEGTNLAIVAAHEFGHALGLGHSSDPGALMAPYYRGYIPHFQLHSDDIAGIQALYGLKEEPSTTSEPTTMEVTTTTTTTTTTAKPTTMKNPTTTSKPTKTQEVTFDIPSTTRAQPANSLCNRPPNSKIQAAFTGSRGVIYIFLNTGQVISNATGSHKIEELFPDGPKYVDAATYSVKQGLLLLFRGVYMWMYTFDGSSNTFSPAENFRKKLKIKVNAATVIRDNYGWERILLFSGQYMYEYQPYFMHVGEPVLIRHMWFNAPTDYDAIIADQKEIHFLHGDKYTSVVRKYNVIIHSPRSIDTLFECA